MGTICMDMSSYEVEHDPATASGYSDEVMCAGWVPALELQEAHSEHVEMPHLLANVDVDAFLRKMYRCQR